MQRNCGYVSHNKHCSNTRSFKYGRVSFACFRTNLGCGDVVEDCRMQPLVNLPILLDRRHHLTVLVVRDAHCRVHHNRVCETLNEIRSVLGEQRQMPGQSCYLQVSLV